MTTHDDTSHPLWARPGEELDATAERPAVRVEMPSYVARTAEPSPAASTAAVPHGLRGGYEALFAPEPRVLDVPQSPAGPVAIDRSEETGGDPNWWHRAHPVFTPLTGFFAGLLTVIVVPGCYGALLTQLFGDAKVKGLLPFGALVLVIPLVLLVPRGTRRFGRYMLFGMISVAIVVLGVGALTAYYLFQHDG